MSRPVRVLTVLLAVSLAINVFCLGAFAAWAWQGGFERGRHGDGRRALFHAERILDGPGRAKLEWLTREQRREVLPRMRALRQARREAKAALERETFDRAEFERALEQVRGETAAIQTHLHGLLSELSDGLTQAQRAELARLNWGRRDRRGDRERSRREPQREQRRDAGAPPTERSFGEPPASGEPPSSPAQAPSPGPP